MRVIWSRATIRNGPSVHCLSQLFHFHYVCVSLCAMSTLSNFLHSLLHSYRHTFQSGTGPGFGAEHMASGYQGVEGEERGKKEG